MMFRMIFAGCVLTALTLGATAQQASTVGGTYSQTQARSPSQGSVSSTQGYTVYSSQSDSKGKNEFQVAQSDVKKATEALKKAESRDEIAEAREELRKALAADYDVRLDHFQSEIDAMAERLDAMRAKLAKRRDAKDEMVELRLKVVEAEADDLGWPNPVSARNLPGELYYYNSQGQNAFFKARNQFQSSQVKSTAR